MLVTRFRLLIFLAAVLTAAAVGMSIFSKPRVLAVDEVPVAFWAWRNRAPAEDEVRRAFAATNASTLFLRAGQFDIKNETAARIRPPAGEMPASVDLHLVYNGTRRFLREFGNAESASLAKTIFETYQTDLANASTEGDVRIRGLQLDLDVPTRLLPKYAELLRHVRETMPPEAALSITGLPTWANSADIHAVLQPLDFWIPQCYGAEVPTRVGQRKPISSPADVARTIDRIRKLEKPFYAGLAAYGYAILYDQKGRLVELRGDIAPAQAERNADLPSTKMEAFKGENGHLRYEFQATNDTVLDGLTIRSGETLVFDVPTAASLRASARAVRENAGPSLLGICVFRLPTAEDRTNLTAEEIAAALADRETAASSSVRTVSVSDHELRIVVENNGSARSPVTHDAVNVELNVPTGSVESVDGLSGFDSFETLCRHAAGTAAECSTRRANVIRLKTAVWTSRSAATATINFRTPPPAVIPASVSTRINDGRTLTNSYQLDIERPNETK